MALTKTRRHRAPLDGRTFVTRAKLQSVVRAAVHYDDDKFYGPEFLYDTFVPLFCRMEKYKAQVRPDRPDGMNYGPVARIGSMESPEIQLFGHHHAAGLSQDYHLDGLNSTDQWHYEPWSFDDNPPGEDSSYYKCDKCNETLYRDERGRRHSRSACLFDGSLVCRDCEVTGLVYDEEAETQLKRTRRLADYVGGDCRARLDRHIETLGRGFSFCHPAQTRLFREDRFSFAWSTVIFTPEGRKRGMNGGLIQHGPAPIEEGDTFRFRTWDYGLKAERDATHQEIRHIEWSIHT